MTVRVKENRSSEFKKHMSCRHCDTDEVESQPHLEISTGTQVMRRDLNTNIEKKSHGVLEMTFKKVKRSCKT